ncbi:hypothetical protein [Pelagibacterium limicola]|uniref:hypothetical protein n=1 Tax=Pelagibacterium limicola TaxID=2791022 RepID=UPI0018AFFC37|nr:hypothetical protein [Pelagibacterium limicola]
MVSRRKWNIWLAFLAGGLFGAAIGTARGVMVYGQFDIGFLFNHVLGGFFLGGVALFLIAAVVNWFKRHPA